ncbi:MAG: 2Fe-2S iron-sulfur cluster-binding protein, partial [Paracoccaceae bacterium]
ATRFQVNGQAADITAPPGERLSETLRERLGLRDVKVGCNAGDCGACTVLVDAAPVCACLMPVQQAEGRVVETLAGLIRSDNAAKKLVETFQDHGAAQCGICTPAMMVSAVALLRKNPRPDAAQVQTALGGVLCRCTGYRKIIEAVVAAGAPARAFKASGAVGTSIRRLDGADKVAGREAFGDDIAPPGTLELRVIRAPFARADFSFGDLDAYLGDAQLSAILTAVDIPGKNCFGVIPAFADQPVFATHQTRFRGEAVACVVGTPERMRAFDAASFPVKWQQLPPVANVPAALEQDAVQLHEARAGNVMCSGFVQCGDASAALARADVTVAGQFTTGFVEHAYIEPEAGFAR